MGLSMELLYGGDKDYYFRADKGGLKGIGHLRRVETGTLALLLTLP